MGFVHRHAVQTVVQYGAIWFTGTLLLAIISWRLTGKALAPTALAMRRQKEFIAAAGHELRSPLAVVKASLDAACRTPVTERATLLRNAEQETDRMARLVEDLLVLANRGARIVLGMPRGFYPGYDGEVHEVYVFEKVK